MPFLDVCHLTFNLAAAIEDETSIFGKEWRMTLQYVSHQTGLKALYTSQLGVESDLWAFLLWENENSRENFYHQTIGFGLVSKYMVKTPSVFLFADGEYHALEKRSNWTIDVFRPETQGPKTQSGNQSQMAVSILSQYSFVAYGQEQASGGTYQGSLFDTAPIGFIKSNSPGEGSLGKDPGWERYSIELHNVELSPYLAGSYTTAPANIADLIRRQPWEYGGLPFDKSEWSDTAYPMSLTFRSMSMLEVEHESSMQPERPTSQPAQREEDYNMCIITPRNQITYGESGDEEVIKDLQREIGLEVGTAGLEEVSVLRSQTEPGKLQFLAVWSSFLEYSLWHSKYVNEGKCDLEFSWASKRSYLSQLEWDSMPLTHDNQSWRMVDKTLEFVQFTFAKKLSATEIKAVENRIYSLTNTMPSCWSENVDARPVVYAEDPIWPSTRANESSCLLLVAWDGTEQRAAWLQNFLANSFTLTGHLAYTLGSISERVESKDYSMKKVYERGSQGMAVDLQNGGDESDESDRDMGF